MHGVAACHRYGVCTVGCVECMVWQHVIGMVCVPLDVLGVTYDMLPHHRITFNDVVFTES